MLVPTCPACGTSVRDQAAACTNCGRAIVHPQDEKSHRDEAVALPEKKGIRLGKKGELIVFGFFALIVVSNVVQLKMCDHPASGASRARRVVSDPKAIQKLNAEVQTNTGMPLLKSYTVDATMATLKINPDLWNSLNNLDQRLLCEFVGRGKFMEKMDLSIARLEVNNTLIGRVRRRGGEQSFNPELVSLK